MFATTPTDVDSTAYEPTSEKPDYWDDNYEEIPFAEAMAFHEPISNQLDGEFGSERRFVRTSDIIRIWGVITGGPEAMIARHNESLKDGLSDVTLTFPNYRTAILWIVEIDGQISDGAWENYSWNKHGRRWSWEDLCYAEIEVNETLDMAVGEGDYCPHLNYIEELTEYDGQVERMIYYVRASGLDREYGKDDLMDDLRAIEGING